MDRSLPAHSALSQYDKWNAEYEFWLAKLLAFEGDNEKEYEELSQITH
jgi:hypothetical protein